MRITAGVLLIVLGLWMLFCSGLVFADAFESFTDTRFVAAVIFLVAIATLVVGIVCLTHAQDRHRGLPVSVVCALGLAVVGALLVFNSSGLLLVIPALLLGLPLFLVLLNEVRKA